MSNTWVIYLPAGDNSSKGLLIPHTSAGTDVPAGKAGLLVKLVFWDGLASYQLVGGVMAYQGGDG